MEKITITNVQFVHVEAKAEKPAFTKVVLSTMEKVLQGKFNENEEKVLVELHLLEVKPSDFLRLMTIEKNLLPYMVEEESDDLNIRHKNQMKALRGAVIEIEREEVRIPLMDENKPLLDNDGKIIVDEEGEVKYSPLLDAEGHPVTKLIGFGETKFISVTLTEGGKRCAERHLD